jgi:hypothetical protein
MMSPICHIFHARSQGYVNAVIPTHGPKNRLHVVDFTELLYSMDTLYIRTYYIPPYIVQGTVFGPLPYIELVRSTPYTPNCRLGRGHITRICTSLQWPVELVVQVLYWGGSEVRKTPLRLPSPFS